MTKRSTTLTRGVNPPERLPADQYHIALYSLKNVGALENAYLELDAEDRLVIFTGENGAGKTTAARTAPAHTFGGAPWQMEEPQRRGSLEAYEIKFTLAGNKQSLIVTKTDKNGLMLEVLQGGRRSRLVRPDEVVKEILDPLTLDPLGFMNLSSDEQVQRLFNTLHIDEAIESLGEERKQDEAERARLNNEIRALERMIEDYVQQNLPAEKHDIAKLERELEAAEDYNATLGQKLAERARLAVALQGARDNRERNRKLIEDMRREIEEGTARVPGLQHQTTEANSIRVTLEELLPRMQAFPDAPAYAAEAAYAQWNTFAQTVSNNLEMLYTKVEQQKKTLTAAEHQVEALDSAVTAAEQNLEQAPAGDPMPAKELRQALERAKLENLEIDKYIQHCQNRGRYEARVAERDEVQARIENYEPRKREAIAAAITTATKAGTLPKGLTFTTEKIYFDNLPLKQYGTAEQLRITIMLALASGPQLRLVCIPDGDEFDHKRLRDLQALAREMNFYIFMARWVDVEEGVGTVLKIESGKVKTKARSKRTEDGHVRKENG